MQADIRHPLCLMSQKTDWRAARAFGKVRDGQGTGFVDCGGTCPVAPPTGTGTNRKVPVPDVGSGAEVFMNSVGYGGRADDSLSSTGIEPTECCDHDR